MLKFSSKPISEHAEAPLADEGRWEELVAHWKSRGEKKSNVEGGNDSYVVSVGADRDPHADEAQLIEIVSLVQHQGDRVTGREACRVPSPNPRTFLGKGLSRDIAMRARESGANMLVLDAELTPSQTRNLEDVAGIPICDREAVILNVFLRHAKTRRARAQVELAQLEYLRPRIRGVGIDMDQQMGGRPGARGPGETASELLARQLDHRMESLRRTLAKMEIAGDIQREQRNQCKRMALVGYTNAGKTSLMNALTAAELSARDMPFETLDTTSRALTRYGGDVVISDTVGFIRRLPERLLSSFESTLAEIVHATLLIIVVDASDHERELHRKTTLEVLQRMGASDIPRFYVLNKIDRLPSLPTDAQLTDWGEGDPCFALSSRDPSAVARLKEALLRAANANEETVSVFVPYERTSVLSFIYGSCRVIESEAADAGLALSIQGPSRVVARVRKLLKEAV